VSQVTVCWHMCYTISCSFNKYEHTNLLELISRPEIMATVRYIVAICCVFLSIVRKIRTDDSFCCDLVIQKENVDPKLGFDTEPNCHLHDYTDVDVVECTSLMSSRSTFSRSPAKFGFYVRFKFPTTLRVHCPLSKFNLSQ
jgi:hypothetical protein